MRIFHEDSIWVLTDVVSDNNSSSTVNENDSRARAIGYAIFGQDSVMRVNTSECNVALNIVRYVVLLNTSSGILCEKDALFEVFVYFIEENQRTGFLCDFDPCLPVEPDDIILKHLCPIVLSFDQNTVGLVANDWYIFLYFSLAVETLVCATNDAIVFLVFDFVQINNWEGTVYLNSVKVLWDVVPADIWFWG